MDIGPWPLIYNPDTQSVTLKTQCTMKETAEPKKGILWMVVLEEVHQKRIKPVYSAENCNITFICFQARKTWNHKVFFHIKQIVLVLSTVKIIDTREDIFFVQSPSSLLFSCAAGRRIFFFSFPSPFFLCVHCSILLACTTPEFPGKRGAVVWFPTVKKEDWDTMGQANEWRFNAKVLFFTRRKDHR